MSVSLINRVKYNRAIYSLYAKIGSSIINLIKWLVPKDRKLIVFVSFGGRKFDDSPKAIYDQMLCDHRFDSYTLVWAFINPNNFSIPRGKKIKIDTLHYYITLLKAAIWITNSSVERGLNFKARNCFYFNSWHGSAIKVMGSDLDRENLSFRIKSGRKKECRYDVFLAQGQFDVVVFGKAFGIPADRLHLIGLPRNDGLVKHQTTENKDRIRKILNIPDDKKLILYAPTFREYDKDHSKSCVLAPPINFVKWKQQLGEDYIFLLRAHYEVVSVMNFEENDFVKDVSSYPILEDLMIVSDLIVSDTSVAINF